MEIKMCTSCKTEKVSSEFNFRYKKEGIRSASCKSCQKNWKDAHYRNNKKQYFERNKETSVRKRAWMFEYKTQLSCEMCGEKHPAVLDFHHKEPSGKSFTVSEGFLRVSKKKLLDEISKCQVLCANCHRKLHWEEKNSP